MDIENSKILIEATYSKLSANTDSGFATPRRQNSNRVHVLDMIFIPSVPDRTLTVKARARSSNDAYEIAIILTEAVFSSTPKPGFTKIKVADGSDYYVQPFKSASANVKVKCDCLDFYYRFSVWNHRDKSLAGNPPPPYVKKTDREPVNPGKVSGVCKHIMKLMSDLRRSRIVT